MELVHDFVYSKSHICATVCALWELIINTLELNCWSLMATIPFQSTNQWNLFMVQSFCSDKGWRDTEDDKGLQNKGNHTPIPFYSVLKYLQETSKTKRYCACYFNMYIIWDCTLTLFWVSLQCLVLSRIKFKKNKGIMWIFLWFEIESQHMKGS
jgi:hypothetical protein